MAGKPDTRELAHEAIGSARLTAFGVSNVAPAGAVAGGLVIVVAYAGLGFATAAVNAIIRILFAMGRERVLPRSLSRLPRRHTPVVAIGCVAALALMLGLPLTFTYGGARAFGYLAGALGFR
jgi:amino acid transporter